MNSQEIEESFGLTQLFPSYISKPEITALSPAYLVKGSKNVVIDYAQRVISRNGFTLYRQANNGGGGIKGSYEWDTSTAKQFSMRSFDDKIQFDWNGTYNTLLTGLPTSALEFAKIWDNTEKIDVLLWVLGSTNTYKWSGGVTKIASSTATTAVKQGVLASTSLGTVTMTIATPAVATFVAHGLVTGNTIQFSTTGALPTGVTAGTTYYIIAAGLTADNFEFSLTAGGAAINSSGGQSGVHTLYRTTGTNGISFVAGDGVSVNATVLDSNNGFVTAGFAAGDTLYVTGSTANSRNFTIASVTAGVISLIMSDVLVAEATGQRVTIHNGEPTWASSRFLTTGTRKITYSGTDYAYTGGEATDTLSGLSGFPTATAGDTAWQTVIVLANPSAINANFKQDLIAVQLNQLILASTKSQEVYISNNTDYTNFTLTSPRAPADPAKVNMDNYATCIVPIDNADQSASSLMFGGGTSEFFQLSYKLSQDNTAELVRMVKLKTAIGSGLISKHAICPIKNSTAYISREPALDSLANVEKIEGKNNVPLSDPVKTDFDSYDFTNAHVIYWKRSLYIALPAEGLVLIYDLMRNLWQPPQTIPVGRFAIINDWLYGHSAITNETYRLFTGTNDNGIFIPQVARFAYNNGGRRDRLKNLSEYWTDGYITANGVLTNTLYFGFDGSLGKKPLTISGSDTSIAIPQTGSTLGDEALGVNPLGGATLDPVSGLIGTNAAMLRFWQVDTVKSPDYIEQFAEYTMNTLDGQFALIAHGSNQWDAGTAPVTHKK